MGKLDDVWNLPVNAVNVAERLWEGTNLVYEFGAGAGTFMWRDKGYDVISFEQDSEFVAKYRMEDAKVSIHHAPIDPKTKFYDGDVLKQNLTAIGIWVIGGPKGGTGERRAVIDWIKKLKPWRLMIDDTHRDDGRDIVRWLDQNVGFVMMAECPSLKGVRHTTALVELAWGV